MKLPTKVELKADLTESTNNIVNKTLEKPALEIGNIGQTLIAFVHNFLLFPIQKYNLYAKDKLEKYESNLKERLLEIPEEKIVEPSINILGPTIESLKYNLDEEHIKKMFTNIIISDMNKDKKNKVLPSYIEIVKQLSPKDAVLIKTFRELMTKQLSILIMKDTDRNTGSYSIINYVIVPSFNRTITPDLLSIDNLERLQLIKIKEGNTIIEEEKMCKDAFNYIKNKYIAHNDGIITYTQAVLEITSFGMNFVEICTDKND